MRISWSERASGDLDWIEVYIKKDSPLAAVEVVLKIIEIAETLLSVYSRIGREGRTGETRELVIPGLPYIVVYEAGEDEIYILRVLHGAQDWPKEF